MPHPVHTRPGLARAGVGLPEARPPGEGVSCASRAAFADVARLGERRPRHWWITRSVACGKPVTDAALAHLDVEDLSSS
jgi:hypothetical protein